MAESIKDIEAALAGIKKKDPGGFAYIFATLACASKGGVLQGGVCQVPEPESPEGRAQLTFSEKDGELKPMTMDEFIAYVGDQNNVQDVGQAKFNHIKVRFNWETVEGPGKWRKFAAIYGFDGKLRMASFDGPWIEPQDGLVYYDSLTFSDPAVFGPESKYKNFTFEKFMGFTAHEALDDPVIFACGLVSAYSDRVYAKMFKFQVA